MNVIFFLGAMLFLLLGHLCKIYRWEKMIQLYEQPSLTSLFQSLTIGYALNFIFPFRIGELVRALYAGRKLKNGVGLAAATIILDRFLDVVAVAVVFLLLLLLGVGNGAILSSARFYVLFTAFLFLALILMKHFSGWIKKSAKKFCGIFNDRIKLGGMRFFWSLINTFRDFWKLNPRIIIGSTIWMWASYLMSYGLLAGCLSEFGNDMSFAEVFTMLFSKTSLDTSSISIMALIDAMTGQQQLLIAAYMLLPIVFLFGITLLPGATQEWLRRILPLGRIDRQAKKILPQIREQDQLQFLENYFATQNATYSKKFIEMNRSISIIRDFSAGSNATTMLCTDGNSTFYRKYAFAEDAKKLQAQVDWLHAHENQLPLCQILREDSGEGYCCYDMVYNPATMGMFRYVHSHPLEQGWAILQTVLQQLHRQLYTCHTRPAEKATIQTYIEQKVIRNLKTLQASERLRELLSWEEVIINGVTYKNLPRLKHLFQPEHLAKIFAGDTYSDIHGDLTIENIIGIEGIEDPEKAYYIIDPNTGNIHESPFLDIAKLLQSLHGGYEFLMMTKDVVVNDNHIDFMYTKSAVYDGLFEALRQTLQQNYSQAAVKSIFYHELVHWLRLLPYKLRKDQERVAVFYAGLIMVANDVNEWFD